MRALDRLIWEQASELEGFESADLLIVCNDPTGALVRASVESGKRVVVADTDYSRCQQAKAIGAEVVGDQRLDEYLLQLAGSCVALGEMPKSLARLDYVARAIAGAGFTQADVILGANNKHLSRTMNGVLGHSFVDVHATRGRGKFRCLAARSPKSVSYTPVEENGFVAIGGVFAGARADYGGQLLRSCLPDTPGALLDLGCGNGAVSKGLEGEVWATDADADAVLSARAIGIDATWDDAGSQFADASFDTVALNPPFHAGTTVDTTLVEYLLDASHRLLKPGGQLFVVFNSHLPYRRQVAKRFEQVEQVARNSKFTVLTARR
ncbi:class I SAM-dependent methyltransferase [Corynebacterium sp. NML130628]|uniref:class I SAM-dependent methyltransferase n=1 Tax=Corynebacterium sp. NML130628 TaxID=1906333 RepID=UPI0008FB9E42|nr:methyltransferase [Corynebacterium sp. NML130628]OIR45463.1 methyltransferase [Corynebacterium sp. NML130628]